MSINRERTEFEPTVKSHMSAILEVYPPHLLGRLFGGGTNNGDDDSQGNKESFHFHDPKEGGGVTHTSPSGEQTYYPEDEIPEKAYRWWWPWG